MSNHAASTQNRKDLLFPSIYHLILDFNQMPSINSINKKDAAFNLIPGRQSKYKVTINNCYYNYIIRLLPLIFNNNSLINFNRESKHIMFGLKKKFYGANLDFFFLVLDYYFQNFLFLIIYYLF